MKEIETLYQLCDAVFAELEEYNNKIKSSNGKMSMSDLEVIDKLTHAIKSIKTTIAMMESEGKEYSGNYMNGRYFFDEGASGRGSYDDVSTKGYYGRGRGANRDHMGRYTERGYSRADANEEFRNEIEELMSKAPDEQSRKKLEKLMIEMK